MAKQKKLTLKKVATLEYDQQLWQARYAPCGNFLVGCGYDASIQRWRLNGDKKPQLLPPLKGHNGWLQCMGFDPRPGLLFTADSWGKLVAWKYQQDNAKPIWQHNEAHDGWIRALAVSPDGNSIATSGNDRVVRVWDSKSGKRKAEWKKSGDRIFSLAFHPNGKSLFCGDLKGVVQQNEFPSGKNTRKFDASKLYTLHRIQECGGARVIGLDAKGERLVCAGQRDSKGGFAGGTPGAIVFETTTGKQLHEIKVGSNTDGFVYDAQFHPDGYVMATSSAFPGKGHLWFWKPGEAKPFFEDRKLTNGRTISIHPKSGQLAMLASNSPNGNGRRLKNGKYEGGSARIYLLQM